MDADTTRSEERRMADLATRIQGLEGELAQARALLTTMHSKLLFERQSNFTDTNTEATLLRSSEGSRHSRRAVTEEATEPIHVEPLPMQHPLRRKWSLGKGIPDASSENDRHRICFTGAHTSNGKLRLFGLLSDGSVWEHYLPFSQLAREGGITIGRDPELVNLVIADNGVSRSHARLELGATGLVISDLNSTNGLYVNEQKITPYNPQTPLTDGSVIGLGDTPLRVEIIQGSH
ncbi:MAG: FHA domain-containing protein [Akkermansia sp.]|nr:FHA domain-containing protein [Akkermansia sp.]